MYLDCIRSAEILFVAADATWRNEAAHLLGRKVDDPHLADHPEAQGRPHTLLRIAYEVRERALTNLKAVCLNLA